jgi:hypothetical protein
MAQITITQPTRSEMRMLFEHALNTARTDGAKAAFGNVAAWHELRWQAEDQAAAAAKEQQAQAAAQKTAEPKQEPAVVTHGMNSPEAQAKRDVRRAKRLADEAKKEAAQAKSDKQAAGDAPAE